MPYLNGGLFLRHQIEEIHGEKIQIADAAFERLFDFFDAYRWHLDERPLRENNEINPDVLGYIFEKYINQKQMGAYYTKEDITGYISKNTIIPFLFDAARKDCAIAFKPDGAVWRLLKDDPDRYIYPAVRHGVDEKLPKEIAAGIKDVSKRGGWNKPAPQEFALPTETWREHVARRQRCEELRRKLSAGEVTEINDLITLNLDIRQFAEDVIVTSEGPELVRAFWKAVERVTVLDPTCGSGAFLFAALNILEPLYEACLNRMEGLLDELSRSGKKHSPKKFADFRQVLERIAQHPNHRYFILKSIMVNNLFGVDIMEEATEICKLRLFLKLVAQVERVEQIEPLPDIDFNIRAGNTLVGFTSLAEVKQSMEGRFDFGNDIDTIEEQARQASAAFKKFREMQTEHGLSTKDLADGKELVRSRMRDLESELDRHLAGEYGIDPDKPKAFMDWKTSHEPFHWFVDFYGIMSSGGFDVIIGNPPYLERSKLGNAYRVRNLKTLNCRDIYSWVVERAILLASGNGSQGMIVPVSLASSASFDVLRNVLSRGSTQLWLSHFANRPGQLFTGAQNRLTIFIRTERGSGREVCSTRYHRWDARGGERDALFNVLQYVPLGVITLSFHGLYAKSGAPEAVGVLAKTEASAVLGAEFRPFSKYPLYWVRVPGYFCQFFLDPPTARPERGGPTRVHGEVKEVFLSDEKSRRLIHAVLNSSAYYQFFCAYTDGRHINPSDVKEYPLAIDSFDAQTAHALVRLSKNLEEAMISNTTQRRKSGLLIDSVDSRPTKPIIDEIDELLAEHFGFTSAERDYVTNYDIKYRMGGSDNE